MTLANNIHKMISNNFPIKLPSQLNVKFKSIFKNKFAAAAGEKFFKSKKNKRASIIDQTNCFDYNFRSLIGHSGFGIIKDIMMLS